MQDTPCLRVLRGVDLATEQELADPVPDGCQVNPQVLAAADRVAQLLLVWFWDTHEPELASAQQTSQPNRVTLVDFDVVVRVLEDVTRSADDHFEASPLRPAD